MGAIDHLHWSPSMLRAAIRVTCLTFILLAGSAGAAAGQHGPSGPDSEETEGKSKSYSWGLGLGGITQQQPYRGMKRDYFPIPLLVFENRWVKLMGPIFDLKLGDLELGENQEISFAVTAQPIGFDGYSSNDAPILNGMSKRKGGSFLGPSIQWSNPYVDVSAKWLYDVSGSSKGQKLSIGLARSYFAGPRLMFTPSVSAIWMNSKYVDYYYGVRASEVRADRPAYFADSTLNVELAVRTNYMIDKHQSVFLSLGYMMLGSQIKNSPLTDRSGESKVFLGYLYRFR
jgi:outer membrane protein